MPLADMRVEFMRRSSSPTQDWKVAVGLPWTTKKVAKYKKILLLGDSPAALSLILDGWASRSIFRRNGSRRITGFMLPGDLCGIHAMTGAKMDHSIVALTNCEIASVPVTEVESAIQSTPSLGRALWRSKLIEEASLRKMLLNSEDAEGAIAHLICEMHSRLYAIGEATRDTFGMPLTQTDLGDALGITAIHTNRMLRRLRQDGLATISKGVVVIGDLAGLQRRANFDPSTLHL